VKREIAQYKGGAPFYFGGKKPLADNTVRRRFIAYTEKAGLPRIRIHDLRHSFVSMLIHNGGNFVVIANLIDDTVEMVTQTYGHLYQQDKLSILERIK
jgi:site-specific recombinase XerD